MYVSEHTVAFDNAQSTVRLIQWMVASVAMRMDCSRSCSLEVLAGLPELQMRIQSHVNVFDAWPRQAFV